MIVLKHLAREFDIDPYKLRQTLRAHKYKPSNGRWSWEPNSTQLAEIRSKLTELFSESVAPTTTSPAPSTPSRRATA